MFFRPALSPLQQILNCYNFVPATGSAVGFAVRFSSQISFFFFFFLTATSWHSWLRGDLQLSVLASDSSLLKVEVERTDLVQLKAVEYQVNGSDDKAHVFLETVMS